MDAKHKIVKAKVKLQKTSPFFAYLIMNLKFIEVKDEKKLSSMGVNNKGECFYNPKFIMKIKDDELHGVLAHEVLHIVFEHWHTAYGTG